MSRYSEYMAFENSHMEGFNQLMTKYRAIKEKECAVTGQSSGRVQKKEALLRLKENNTITDGGRIELDFIDAEDKVETNYNRNIEVIRRKKENAIRQAEIDYEKGLEYYDSEKQASLTKAQKKFDSQKRIIEAKKQRIEDERNISIKTATEIAINQQKIDILTQMQKMVKVLQVSRNSLEQRDKDRLPPMIELPEPIVTQYVHTTPTPAIAPVATPTPIPRPMPDISMLGEDADLLAMREENRARRRERDRKREEETTTVRKPTVYGFIHEIEGRPPTKRTYVPKPVTDDTFDMEAHNKDFADIE